MKKTMFIGALLAVMAIASAMEQQVKLAPAAKPTAVTPGALLWHAINNDNIDEARRVIKDYPKSVNEMIPEVETIPLIFAVKKGNVGIVQLLLDNGALANYQDKLGQTALMEASISGKTAIAKLLLEYGGDSFLRNKAGKNAWTMAKEAGHQDIALLFRAQTL